MTLARFACILLLAPWVQPLDATASDIAPAVATCMPDFATNPAVAVSAATFSTTPLATTPGDSLYKSWYFTPTGVFGRIPLDRPKNRHYIRLSHPSATESVVEDINPAGILTNITHFYFRGGLISLETETGRWGEIYDSTWYRSDGPDKFLVTERKRGVNPFLPCKYEQLTFKNDLITDIVCYLDSIRAGADQEGVAHYAFERYDDPSRRGLIKSESFFTDIDMPTLSRSADCHKIVSNYNLEGDVISRSIYDQDDKPMIDRNGVFRTKFKYDGQDNETEEDCFGKDDRPVVTAGGFSVRFRDYRRGLLREESYELGDHTPTICSSIGPSVSFIDYEYDAAGNQSEISFFDTQHRPVNNLANGQRVVSRYSPSGMITEQDQYSLDKYGSQIKGYISAKFTRDAQGRIIRQQFESSTGALIADRDNGVMLTKIRYDAWGRPDTFSFWQNDSTKMTSRLGCHEIVIHYDQDGQMSEKDFYDEYGEPSSGRIGYSRLIVRRDAQGLPAEFGFFAGDNPVSFRDPRAAAFNFHRMTFHFDLQNRLRSIGFYDVSGKPAGATIHPNLKTNYTVSEIALDYKGATLSLETLKDTGTDQVPVTLDCAAGNCLSLSDIESLKTTGSENTRVMVRTYHSHIAADSLFCNTMGFIGQDSILAFISKNWASQTALGCAEYYRHAHINKYYQLDGQVIDHYLDDDSVAAVFNYSAGTLEGPVSIYYPNGVLKEKGTYHNNARSGLWYYYYDNGQKQRTLLYQPGQPPLVADCYAKDGQMLAQNGAGRFEGVIQPAAWGLYDMALAKGNLQNGLPTGEWTIYSRLTDAPAFTEYFSGGKFQKGYGLTGGGKFEYKGFHYTSVEGARGYESLDYFDVDPLCRPSPVLAGDDDIYSQIKEGLGAVIKTNKFKDFEGWIFLDVTVGMDGHVRSSYVRLYQPNVELQNHVRRMADFLTFPSVAKLGGGTSTFERMYIILMGGNEILIPEEYIATQRKALSEAPIRGATVRPR